jgi:hypothetical protein
VTVRSLAYDLEALLLEEQLQGLTDESVILGQEDAIGLELEKFLKSSADAGFVVGDQDAQWTVTHPIDARLRDARAARSSSTSTAATRP